MTFASLCEPRPELGESRKTWAYKCPAGSFNIKHICILRSVLPTLACQKEHLDLSGVAYFLSQNLAWLPRGVGRRGGAYCCLGARCFPLCHTTGRLNSNPSRIQARGSSKGPPPPAVLSVTLVLECLCGTKDALFLMGQSLLLGSPMCPCPDCFLWIRHNPLLPRALEPLC